ncbi:hypothetical protein BCAR13_1840029 [Paraburkholderia caribensis]|nr:hypothetical protein BCAR13_1840029 [Paraburkholderia caribensis]
MALNGEIARMRLPHLRDWLQPGQFLPFNGVTRRMLERLLHAGGSRRPSAGHLGSRH